MTINTPDAFADMLAEISLDAAALEAVARAYDREDSAQMGEPDPWTVQDTGLNPADPEWRSERLACALAGLEALGEYWRTLDEESRKP